MVRVKAVDRMRPPRKELVSMSSDRSRGISRRALLRALAGVSTVAAGAPLLAACSQPAASPTTAPASQATPPAPTTAAATTAPAAATKPAAATTAPVATSAAATAAPKTAGQPAEIRWRTYSGNGDPGKTLAPKIVEQFQALNPQIKVTHEAFGVPDWMRLFVTDVAAGTPPDVIQEATEYFDKHAVTGVLLKLDDYIKAERYDLEGFQKIGLDMCRSKKDGALYALPEGLVPNLVWYNVDLFQEAGIKEPPEDGNWTFDDMLNAAKAITKRDNRGVASQWGIHLYRTAMPFAWYDINSAFGGESVDAKWSKTLIHEGGAREGTKWIFDLYAEHKVAPTPDDQQGIGTNPFFVGKAGMFYNYLYALDTLLTYPKLNFRGVPAPKGKAGNKSNLRPWYHSVAQLTKSPDAAAKFLMWFMSPDGLSIWSPVTITSRPAVNKSTWEQLPPAAVKRPQLAEIGQKFGYAAVYGPGHGDWFGAMGAELEKAYTGQASFDQAIEAAAKAGDKVIQENNEAAGLKP